MSKKLLKTVGKVAGVVAAVAMIGTGIGAALGGTMLLALGGLSVSASAIAGGAGLISAGASLLTKPKSPKLGTATETRLQVSINVRRARVAAFGLTAFDTDLRDQEFTGSSKEFLHRFLVGAAHRVNAIKEIWFDDQLAWSVTGGVQSAFAGYLTVAPVLEGAPGNAINIGPRMGSSRRFTGCAYVHFRFKLTGNNKKTESPFAQQVPTRVTIVGEGMPCYDARQDSTRPGGSGAHRADDQGTWTWGDHCHNPACQLGTWMLGWKIQNPQSLTWKLSVGQGTPPDRIDWASFIEAANLCDEPVALAAGGTEPRYRAGGLVDEDDGPSEIIDAFKAAMNADLDDQDGLLRLTVFHNDLATPDADFTEADIQGGCLWLQTPELHESFNVVRGSYIEPAALYQPAPGTEIAIASPDGKERAHPADFGLVQSKSQDTRLRKQRLQRQLYGGTFRATFLASGWKVHKNSVVRLSFEPEGWVNKLFRVAEHEVREDGLVPMVLREEHADIYAWDAEEGPAVQLAAPTAYLPGEAPIPQFLGTIEEGATVGAIVPTPAGDGGNIRHADLIDPEVAGAAALPGELLNTMLDLTPGGVLRYAPTLGAQPIALGTLRLPDLGAAAEAVVRQAGEAQDRLATAVLRLTGEASFLRTTMRDAGISVDAASGQVHLHAFERAEDRLNQVDLRLNAAEAGILLRASTAYVDQQIALATIDPSQIADFEDIYLRLDTAELDINALNASVSALATTVEVDALEARVTTAEADITSLDAEVTLRVETTAFDALETRVDSAESSLSAIGNVAEIRDAVRVARLTSDEQDDAASNLLRSLLTEDRHQRATVSALADARRELTAHVVDGDIAEAAARTALAARVSATEAGLTSESLARAGEDEALASDILTLSAEIDDEVLARQAAVQTETLARVARDETLATQIVGVGVAADADAASTLAALLTGDKAQRAAVTAVADARREITARLLDGDTAEAAERLQLQARVGAAEASVATESVARSDGDSALAGQITQLSAELDDETAARSAAILSEQTARVGEDTALSGRIDTLTADLDDANAAITAEAVARADADDAIASDVTSLTATVGTKVQTFVQADAPTASAVGDLWFDADDGNKAYRWSGSAWVAADDTRIAANSAAITSEQTARADADSALSTQISSVSAVANAKNRVFAQASTPTAEAVGDLWIDTGDDNRVSRWSGSAWVAVDDARIAANAAAITTETQARVDGDGALAADINTVSTTVNGHTASITTHASSIDGLEARVGVRLDVNGRVTGWILNSGVDEGGIDFVVDFFRIWTPDGAVNKAPFEFRDGGLYVAQLAVDSLSVKGGSLSELIVEEPPTLLRAADGVLVGFLELPTLPAGTSAVRVTMTGDFQIEETSAEHVWVRLREVSAAQAAAFKADAGAVSGGYPTLPSSATQPMNSDKLEYVNNVWDNAMVSWIDTAPESGQLYLITMDALASVDVRWRHVQLSAEIIKRTTIS